MTTTTGLHSVRGGKTSDGARYCISILGEQFYFRATVVKASIENKRQPATKDKCGFLFGAHEVQTIREFLHGYTFDKERIEAFMQFVDRIFHSKHLDPGRLSLTGHSSGSLAVLATM